MESVKYLFKPYSLVVRYFGCVVVMEVVKDELHGSDLHPKDPVLTVFRFWTERGLRNFAARHDVRALKKESGKNYSCSYYQS